MRTFVTQISESADPLADILAAHGSPRVAALADDLVTTTLHVADWLGVYKMAPTLPRHSAHAELHATLAALAAAAGDGLSTREHARTAALLAHDAQTEKAALANVEAQFDTMPMPNCAYAVFDLGRGSVSFDFLHYLVLAERFRQASGKLGLHVIFVPGEGDGFRRSSQYDLFADRDTKVWRLNNLLVPCAQLLPHCVGVKICTSRAEAAEILAGLPAASIFPQGYTVATPSCPYDLPSVMHEAATGAEIRALRAPALAAALVQRWFAEIAGDKPVVSITVRQRHYQPERNSNLDAWRRFAEHCVAQGFHPVFIPDTEALLDGTSDAFAGFSVLNLPALSIGYRTAVYQQSFVNMMVNNGPYALCSYHPTARFLMFKMLTTGVHITSAAFLASQGLMPGTQFRFSGPHQTIVWDDDRADVIIRAFNMMVENVLAEHDTDIAQQAATG
jgi:hypothetical protein